jgi:hemerythrin-like metal-binding protein
MNKNAKPVKANMMPKLVWDNQYSIGIEAIDAPHRVLFEYINELRDIMLGNKPADVIESTFYSILNYTITQFLDEEVLLYQNEYPDYENHKQVHDEFMNEIKSLYVRFRAGDPLANGRIVSAEVTAILTEWIQVHIMNEDKRYAEYFRNAGLEVDKKTFLKRPK